DAGRDMQLPTVPPGGEVEPAAIGQREDPPPMLFATGSRCEVKLRRHSVGQCFLVRSHVSIPIAEKTFLRQPSGGKPQPQTGPRQKQYSYESVIAHLRVAEEFNRPNRAAYRQRQPQQNRRPAVRDAQVEQ